MFYFGRTFVLCMLTLNMIDEGGEHVKNDQSDDVVSYQGQTGKKGSTMLTVHKCNTLMGRHCVKCSRGLELLLKPRPGWCSMCVSGGGSPWPTS